MTVEFNCPNCDALHWPLRQTLRLPPTLVKTIAIEKVILSAAKNLLKQVRAATPQFYILTFNF